MSGLSELPKLVESAIFVAALLGLIYVLVEALEAAPVLEFNTKVDDTIEDGYDAVAGLWDN